MPRRTEQPDSNEHMDTIPSSSAGLGEAQQESHNAKYGTEPHNCSPTLRENRDPILSLLRTYLVNTRRRTGTPGSQRHGILKGTREPTTPPPKKRPGCICHPPGATSRARNVDTSAWSCPHWLAGENNEVPGMRLTLPTTNDFINQFPFTSYHRACRVMSPAMRSIPRGHSYPVRDPVTHIGSTM